MITEISSPESGETPAEDQAKLLILGVFQSVLHDPLWRLFGFKKCPKRGRIWDRFMNPERLATEEFLSREFATVGLAQTVISIRLYADPTWHVSLIARVLSGLVSDEEIRKAFHFRSAQE